MYILPGGCSTFFHLAVKYPFPVLGLTLSGFGFFIQNHGPGDRIGADALMKSVGDEMVQVNPALPAQVENLRRRFEALEPVLTEDQARQVLKCTDACTDASVDGILSSPELSREAAWLLYLDTYAREGHERADIIFRKPISSPQRE